jgi:hypothetical protein
MASGPVTLAELATINNENLSGVIADELLQDTPLLRALAAIPSSNGVNHSYLRYDDAPSVGFRAANDGRVESSSSDTQVDIVCKILDASYSVDVQVARAYRNGPEALLQREGIRHMRSAFQVLEKQVLYGLGNAADGFEGMPETIDSSLVVDHGGSANLSSIWFVRNAADAAALVLGNDGNISMDPAVMQRVNGSTGTYGAFFTNVSSWFGFQQASKWDIARLANIDVTAQLDDDDIANVLKRLPYSASFMVMNRDVLELLRKSRTATSATGAPAENPSAIFGVPVIVTDQLSSTETQVV